MRQILFTIELILILLISVSVSAIDIDSLLIKSVGGPSALDSIAAMTGYRAEGSVILNGQPGRFVEYFA
ncbi:MAG: hypothetical protein U9R56_02475, partial [candidate division Zixibacteria bacterium]|nr:hypothetical protein [candidate division Zixibacteria bacterium]